MHGNHDFPRKSNTGTSLLPQVAGAVLPLRFEDNPENSPWKKKKKQTSNMFKKSLNQNWNVHYRYMRIKIKVICIGIPYFHDWKPGRFRTTALIRQMWFISYLEYVAIFAQYCSSFTWIDLNSKSFTFTPTSGTSIELNEQIYPLFQGRQNSGRSWGENKRLEGN